MMSEPTFRLIYSNLYSRGKLTSPRGLKTIEIENCNIKFPPYVRFCNFTTRNLKLNYIKREFKWYLRGDKKDLSITKHAKLWNEFIDNGLIHSNYGQYIFGQQNQFQTVVNILEDDKDSRRASIVILQPYHLQKEKVIDAPCTYGINFRIRENKLNMTVKMRSQDAYFGLGSDIPIFSFIHEMMLKTLQEKYPELNYGTYHHFVESFHIYEKDFEFIQNLHNDSYEKVYCPRILDHKEVAYLIKGDFKDIPSNYLFTKWLCDI